MNLKQKGSVTHCISRVLSLKWILICTLVFQVNYDLGGIFFQQGCTDQTAYEKARDHFRQTKELFTKVDSLVYHLSI